MEVRRTRKGLRRTKMAYSLGEEDTRRDNGTSTLSVYEYMLPITLFVPTSLWGERHRKLDVLPVINFALMTGETHRDEQAVCLTLACRAMVPTKHSLQLSSRRTEGKRVPDQSTRLI